MYGFVFIILGTKFIDYDFLKKNMPILEFECPHDDCGAEAKLNLVNLETLKHDTKTITCGSCRRSIKFEYRISPISRVKKYRDPEWLRTEYVDNNKTMSEIALMCNTTAMTIHHWVKRHGIEARSGGTRKTL